MSLLDLGVTYLNELPAIFARCFDNRDITRVLVKRGTTVTRYAATLLKLPHPELRAEVHYAIEIAFALSTYSWITMRSAVFLGIFVIGVVLVVLPLTLLQSRRRL
jgi:hypothetical protein